MAAALSDRAFGLTFAGFLAIVTGAIGWARGGLPVGLALLALAFLATALIAPVALLPLNRLWMRIARRIGIVTNYLLLGAFLYLIVLPTGLVLRALRIDPTARRFAPEAETYLTPVKRHSSAETLIDQF